MLFMNVICWAEQNPQVLGSALEYKNNCQSVKVTYLAQGSDTVIK